MCGILRTEYRFEGHPDPLKRPGARPAGVWVVEVDVLTEQWVDDLERVIAELPGRGNGDGTGAELKLAEKLRAGRRILEHQGFLPDGVVFVFGEWHQAARDFCHGLDERVCYAGLWDPQGVLRSENC